MSVSTVTIPSNNNLLPSQNIFCEVQTIHDTGIFFGNSDDPAPFGDTTVSEVCDATRLHHHAKRGALSHCLRNGGIATLTSARTECQRCVT